MWLVASSEGSRVIGNDAASLETGAAEVGQACCGIVAESEEGGEAAADDGGRN